MSSFSAITITIADTENDFFQLRKEWEELEKNVADLTVFQTWVFQFYAWKTFADKVHPYLALARNEKGELVGCAPLGYRITKIGPVVIKQLGFCCVKYCDFQNFIVHKNYQDSVLPAFAEWLLAQRKNWHIMQFKLLREDFTLLTAPELFTNKVWEFIRIQKIGLAPFISIDKNWSDFQNALSSKRAKAVRYEVKNLYRYFPGRFQGYKNGPGLEQALEQLMDLHQKRIRQKHQLGAFATDAIRCGFQNLVRELEKRGYIAIHTISSNDRTIAAIGTFTFQNKVLYFQGGFEPEWNRYSPGKVVLAQRITEAITAGAEEFDFLFGDEDYKFAWSTGQRKIVAFAMKTGSLRGWVFNQIMTWQNRLLQSDRFRAWYFKLFS